MVENHKRRRALLVNYRTSCCHQPNMEIYKGSSVSGHFDEFELQKRLLYNSKVAKLRDKEYPMLKGKDWFPFTFCQG